MIDGTSFMDWLIIGWLCLCVAISICLSIAVAEYLPIVSNICHQISEWLLLAFQMIFWDRDTPKNLLT